MNSWHFCQYVAQQIKEIAGEDVYRQYGPKLLTILMARCSEDFNIVRYPDDEEIKLVIQKEVQT